VDAGVPGLNGLAYVTPVVVLIGFHLAPAALALYWLVQSVGVVVQQRLLNRRWSVATAL
jgi:membrane protein insertase Oxa1/YidC/SpoIIIJ